MADPDQHDGQVVLISMGDHVQVAAYVRTRTLEEVLLMVKEHQGASSTRMQKQEDWKGAAKKRAEVTSSADTRDTAFTDVQVGGQLSGLGLFTGEQ